MSSSEFERLMGIVPGVFTHNVPSLGNSFIGKCIVILPSPDPSPADNKKIDGICASLTRKGAAFILKSPKNGTGIMEYMKLNRIECENAAPSVGVTDAKALTPKLIVIVYTGIVIACGKSTITNELLRRLPNSAFVSKEGLSSPVYKKNLLRLAADLSIDILIIDKNHPDIIGLDSTFSTLGQIKSRNIILLTIAPKELEQLTVIEERIRARTGKTFGEIGTTFIPGTEGLEDGEWENKLLTIFYEPSSKNLGTFKRIPGAMIMDLIRISPEENAHIIADRILSQEPIGASLFDIISPAPAPSKPFTYVGAKLNVVGDYHVTLHHTIKGPAPECINALIGQEVNVVFTKYVRAKKDGKTIAFWMVDSIYLKETGEVIELPDFKLFHITDQAALRDSKSANASIAKEVMKEIRENDDPAKSESSRGDVPKPKWRWVIIPSSGQVSGIIKRM
jgi:hypothetical protein